MILLELKGYIQQHQSVSQSNIQNRFDLTADALQGLLQPLLRQGHIQTLSSGACSSGQCSTSCQSSAETYYRWSDQVYQPINIPLVAV